MIRRTFLQAVALSVGTLTGWLKGSRDNTVHVKCRKPHLLAPIVTCGNGWTVTHRIDKDGLHVIRSTQIVERHPSRLARRPPPAVARLFEID